jgi:hypothetical protein
VETLEQVSPILVLLLLVLLNGGDAFSHHCLPLGVLVKLVLDVMLCLLDGGQPGVEARVLHLLLMIAHVRLMVAHVLVMVAIGHRSTCAFPGSHLKLLCRTI